MTSGPAADDGTELARAHDRLALLSDISAALASILDVDETLRRLARLVVPHFASSCAVDLLEGDRVRRVTVAPARDPRRREPAASALPAWSNDSVEPLARVLRGAGPLGSAGHGPSEGPTLVVPLQARREVRGALTLVRDPDGRPFDEQDRSLAADIGHRAGLAVENAHLYDLQQHTAEQFQRSLLPELGDVRHLRLEARYVPARTGVEVGGDWYDAFRLVDGSTVLAVGDVVGHDLKAAVRMAQMRNMLRALAFDSGDSPAGVMRRLDAVMQGLSSTELVTAVIVRVHTPSRGPWLAQWTNAGHPAPVLVTPQGRAHLLEEALSPVLGVDPDLRRADAVTVLPPGATLLLYTDGLVERPGEDIKWGLTRLRQHAARLCREPPGAFCDGLLSALAGRRQDDVALLALRVPV
ncbi:PP2C family protein-serine/threonine phosphatase [Streptomyces sp. NPDC050560]|uniref:PP2C family protein-serine/threonine phosphatase n=1 Tax=Streptomyces sp. NPDC050560 TaxID=3365630 RepID=UPI0037A487E9